MIQVLTSDDWEDIKRIYIEGINTSNATFETVENVTTYSNWASKKISSSCIGYKEADQVLGWATLSKVSSRAVYSGVAEVSVYVGIEHGGKGIGSNLLDALITYAETNGFWTLQAGIFPENTGSIKLHKKFDFRRVGYREKISRLNGEWRDNLFFERRSKHIF